MESQIAGQAFACQEDAPGSADILSAERRALRVLPPCGQNFQVSLQAKPYASIFSLGVADIATCVSMLKCEEFHSLR
jgi:hypothetical protein